MVQKSGEPVEVGSLSHYLRRVVAPSQVVHDFWTINSMNTRYLKLTARSLKKTAELQKDM